MKRALITGASGFIGRGALEPLRQLGYEVHAVTSRSPPQPGGNVHWVQADLLAPGAAAALVERVAPTHLLHFAWYAEPGKFWTSPLNDRWVSASEALLAAFAGAGGERAVLAGSCAEYRWDSEPCRENVTALEPATPYGRAKLDLVERAGRISADAGLSLACGRIFFTFGPHEHPARLVSSVARALTSGEPAETSAGRGLRDFLYAPDVAAAFCAVLDSDVEGPINVASGDAVPIREVVELVGAASGRPELLRIGALPEREGEPEQIVADTGRLRDEVGWVPSRTLPAAIRETVDWWRGQV